MYNQIADLQKYGVTVIFADDIVSYTDKAMAVQVIWNAVTKTAEKLAQESGKTPSEAFQGLWQHSSTVTVSAGTPAGCTQGESSCSTGNMIHGDKDEGPNIFLRLDDLRDYGEGLVIHEFGHTFSNPTCENNIPCDYDFNGGQDSIYNFFRAEGMATALSTEIAAHNIRNYSALDDPSTSAAESTANAFAAWVLGDFTELPEAKDPNSGYQTKEKARDQVNLFFKNLVSHRIH